MVRGNCSKISIHDNEEEKEATVTTAAVKIVQCNDNKSVVNSNSSSNSCRITDNSCAQ